MKRVSLLMTLFAAVAFFMASCGGSETPAAEEAADTNVEQADEATEPAAEEATDEATEADVTVNIENGKAVYDKACFACHAAGVAGAAKLDDKARWEASAAKGIATLDANAINGFTGEHGVMPPKGGNMDLTESQIHDIVDYMIEASK